MLMTHTHKLNFKGQSAQKIERKQTDGQTDGRTDGRYDCFTFSANAVVDRYCTPQDHQIINEPTVTVSWRVVWWIVDQEITLGRSARLHNTDLARDTTYYKPLVDA